MDLYTTAAMDPTDARPVAQFSLSLNSFVVYFYFYLFFTENEFNFLDKHEIFLFISPL